jgi:hypothetical protein
MSAAAVKETLALVKAAQGQPSDEVAKSINLATGLVAYDLQAPAKNLYPVNTPLRNSIPRVGGGTGPATNWKQVSAITGSGLDADPWVPEGVRAGRMSYTTADKAATYVTIGEEDQITYEARSASQGFEDEQAKMVMRLLQKQMLKEESAILGGNKNLALGTSPTPTLSAGGSGATLPAATYVVYCVALSFNGYRNLLAAGNVTGVQGQITVTSADGSTFNLNSGNAGKSAAPAGQAVTLGQTLSATVVPLKGAVAYAWYAGLAGSEKLEKVTTQSWVQFSAPLAGTGQAATAVTGTDRSSNSLAFDGFFASAAGSSSLAYFNQLATGTAGTGTLLTASGRGSVNEIDAMLRSMWDNYQVSPTVLYVNSQELANISAKVLSTSSAPLLRYNVGPDGGTTGFSSAGAIDSYYNPFAMNPGGVKIPVRLHPMLPAGSILAYAENLPVQYQSNNVPNVAEVKTRQDYYQINWPLKTRAQEVGVYAEEVLAIYAQFAIGLICNISNG